MRKLSFLERRAFRYKVFRGNILANIVNNEREHACKALLLSLTVVLYKIHYHVAALMHVCMLRKDSELSIVTMIDDSTSR